MLDNNPKTRLEEKPRLYGDTRAVASNRQPAAHLPLNNDQNTDSKAVYPLTDFVTTSSVINSINSALEDVMKQELGEEVAQNCRGKKQQSFFELQKRMPDGSTRKATDEETSSEDMKNKLEQAAKLTSIMSLDDKIEWAQKQRQQGNELYKAAKYKEAIDMYLTCLVVRDMIKEKVDDQQVLILPVMNNLSQCALQLGWYHKAEVFCTLALESLDINSRNHAVAKLYFKRSRSRRLRGLYHHAKCDLHKAVDMLGVSMDDNEKSPEQRAIEREFQLLAQAAAEGIKNKKRAQRGMQKVLGSTSEPNEAGSKTPMAPSDAMGQQATEGTEGGVPNAKDESDIPPTTPLYHEKHGRTHSAIRKRPGGPPPYEQPHLAVELNFWQVYRLVIGRVAQRLLDIIGEDEGASFGASAPGNYACNSATRVKQD